MDELPDPEFTDAAARRNLTIVPTLSLLKGYTGIAEASVLGDSSVTPYLPPTAEAQLRLTGTLAAQIPDPEEWLRSLNEAIRRLRAGGVRLLAGTDAGNPGTTHGAGLHEELAALVEAGLSPAEALTTATAAPAVVFGLSDRGRIAVGQRADLLLIRGDPTRDITMTRDIVGVWKLGIRVDREAYRAAHTADRAAYEALQEAGSTKLADFEGDEQRPTATVGNWGPYNDMIWGGQSTSVLSVVDRGAAGTSKSLSIQGTIVANEPMAVSGALLWPFGPVDLSAKSELLFWARGSGEEYRVIMNGPGMTEASSYQTFVASEQWSEIVIPLDGFAGIDPRRVVTFVFGAGGEPGNYSFQIDEVRIR